MPHAWNHAGYTLDEAVDRLDIGVIHGYLTTSYWSPGIPAEAVVRAIAHSRPFGLYHGEDQVGFARVVSDLTHFAYLADVFVLPAHRGRGLAKWMVATIVDLPDFATVRRWMLATRDAHDLYAAVGFTALDDPERYMTLRRVPPWQPAGDPPA